MRQNCGVSGADLTSVVNQTGESLNLINWVNEAWLDIQAQSQDWLWMRRTITFPTVLAQPTYSTSQIGLTDFGMWARDTFRNYQNPVVTVTIASPGVFTLAGHGLSFGDTVTPFTTGALPTGLSSGSAVYVKSVLSADTFTVSLTLGGTAIATTGSQSGTHTLTSNNYVLFSGFKSEIFMEYIGYDDWRNTYEYGALRSTRTRPLNMTITPDKSIGVGPFPDAGYTIVGDYYSVPTEMAANTDTPSMPDKFHLSIVYRAMMAYGQYESAPEVFSRGQAEYMKWIRRVHMDRLQEVMGPGALC